MARLKTHSHCYDVTPGILPFAPGERASAFKIAVGDLVPLDWHPGGYETFVSNACAACRLTRGFVRSAGAGRRGSKQAELSGRIGAPEQIATQFG